MQAKKFRDKNQSQNYEKYEQRPFWCSVNKNAQKKAKTLLKLLLDFCKQNSSLAFCTFVLWLLGQLNSTEKCSYILCWNETNCWRDRNGLTVLLFGIGGLVNISHVHWKYCLLQNTVQTGRAKELEGKAKLRENNSLLSCRQFCPLLFLPFYGLV